VTATADAIPREELIRRAREMVPDLRARAAEAETNRAVHDETMRAFVDAGFLKILQPAHYGGLETDLGLLVDIAAELGRGCGSSCWLFTNLAMQALVNGMKDPEAQEEVWDVDPDTLTASANKNPDATVEMVEGGLMVDGVWNYSSGVDFAEWINLQIFLRPEDGPPEHRFSAVHKSDFEVIDDWFVTGMAATGSRSIKFDHVFIPDYRQISSLKMHGGPTPGSAVNPGTLYRMPFWGIGAKLFSAPAIGIARGALELTEGDIEARIGMGGAKLAEQPTVHVRLAESGAEIDAAWSLLLRDCEEAVAMTEAGEIPTLLKRASWRRNNAFAVQLCLRATDRLYALSGMRGMLPDSDVQRAWRDIHAAAAQVALAWDPMAGNYGRARFDLPMADPRV